VKEEQHHRQEAMQAGKSASQIDVKMNRVTIWPWLGRSPSCRGARASQAALALQASSRLLGEELVSRLAGYPFQVGVRRKRTRDGERDTCTMLLKG